jgi:hypothetical protein
MSKILINIIEFISEVFERILIAIEFLLRIFISYPFNIFAILYVSIKLKNRLKIHSFDLKEYQEAANKEFRSIEYLRIHLSCIFWLSILAYVLIF